MGRDVNILDLYNGRDLNLTVRRGNTENQTVIEIIESGVDTPVSSNPEQLNAWLNDDKKWQDVFTAKPYDYLHLILEGKYPWFDRELKKWVDRDEYNARHNNTKREEEQEAEKKIKETSDKLNTTTTSSMATAANQVVEDHIDDDEDIPF